MSSHRFAVSTWISSARLLCRLRALHPALLSISARAPVCSPRYWHGVASSAWSLPISILARWRVRVRTFDSSGFAERVAVVQADLFPEGRAALVICNPPWIPARPSSPMENGIYDPDSRMLRGFLRALPEHLEPGGEGWLILSDLAEHLGLRTRAQLLEEFEAAGLRVVGRNDVPPRHPRAADRTDPLHVARAAEITSLWRARGALERARSQNFSSGRRYRHFPTGSPPNGTLPLRTRFSPGHEKTHQLAHAPDLALAALAQHEAQLVLVLP